MLEREDLPLLAGGAAALLVLPAAVLGLGAPLWAGLALALAAFGGFAALPAAQGALTLSGPGVRAPLARSGLEAVQATAEPALERLAQAGGRIAHGPTRTHVQALAQAGAAVLAEVRADPADLGLVQRFLTYYVPSAAQIADAYAALEEEGLAAPERLAALEALLGRLAQAGRRYAQVLLDAELQALQAEIDLVEAALREDLGAPAPSSERIP
jgi:hypothetical protein